MHELQLAYGTLSYLRDICAIAKPHESEDPAPQPAANKLTPKRSASMRSQQSGSLR